MACLCPRNSISNVVASVTIDANIYIYVRDVAKRHETIVEGHKHIHVHLLTLTLALTLTDTLTLTLILRLTLTFTLYTYTNTRACTCAFVCACACVCDRVREVLCVLEGEVHGRVCCGCVVVMCGVCVLRVCGGSTTAS